MERISTISYAFVCLFSPSGAAIRSFASLPWAVSMPMSLSPASDADSLHYINC